MTLPLSNGDATPRLASRDNTFHSDAEIVETDLLIVGTGPAGASLACFLASHGMITSKQFKRL